MRISDWSSDVCSSDLHEHLTVLEQDRWRHRTQRPLAGRDGVGRALDEPEAVRHPWFRSEIVHLVVEEEARVAGDFADPEQIIDRVSDGDRVALFRSEEHTSELQSLMRISYAVFCLKKKR